MNVCCVGRVSSSNVETPAVLCGAAPATMDCLRAESDKHTGRATDDPFSLVVSL